MRRERSHTRAATIFCLLHARARHVYFLLFVQVVSQICALVVGCAKTNEARKKVLNEQLLFGRVI